MKITFVYPRFEKFLSQNSELDRGMVDYFLGDFTTPPSLGIPIMASWTPPEIDVELVDDNSGDPVDFDAPTDLVAINCFTPQATRAFALGDGYRAAGKKVIMGGFFPSFMVDECLKHADSVNVGEVEPTWLAIIEDVRKGELKRKYVGGCRFDLTQMKIPRRDIFYDKKSYDWDEDLIQLTRGCLYNCAMCTIPAHMGSRIRFRPIDAVVAELKTLKYENVYLADDTLFFPHRKMVDYATELFKRIEPLNKKYFVASTMALNVEPDFLDLAARAGVRNFYCTMNVDPVSIQAIQGGKKERQMLFDLVKMLEDRQIRFFGSFAVGRDWDDTSIAEKVLDLYVKANIHTSEFFLFTPYPGAVQWDRLERQGRIFDKNWSHYNGAHVVARHPTMTTDELYGQFITIWKEFFKLQKDRHVTHLEPATYQEGKQIIGKPLQRKGVRGQAVVTGIGLFSPVGNDPVTVTNALRDGVAGLAPITSFDTTHFRTPIGGQIRDFHPEKYLSESECDEFEDLYLQYAIAAARKALDNAGISRAAGAIRRDIALVLGTCNGGLLSAEEEYRWKHGQSTKPFDEKMNLQAQMYGFGKALSRALGIGGECWVVTTACSSTTGALGLAQMLVNREYYKTVVVGGSDSLCVANMSGFNGIKATSTGQTAPFSLPEGLNVGEASAFWVVEEMEGALLREARCLGKLAGHATTSDAYHPTTPDPRGDGVTRTLAAALADSGIPVTELGCVNAHGTGTSANDRAESRGIERFLNGEAVPAISLKSFFGHCMGTSGVLEATCNLLAMNAGFIPPTINFSEPRPGCTLDYVPNKSRTAQYNSFISANYAFGGNNAAVVVTRWDYENPVREKVVNKVVVTGVGTVTSLGLSVSEFVARLHAGDVGIGSAARLGLSGLGSNRAGLINEFNGARVDRRVDFDAMNPISRYATAAAKNALDSAQLKVTRRNAEDVGIVMGMCNGPDEMGHMDSVFASGTFAGDITSFSNIVANSTAGWVSNALCLKGANTTLSPGPHAGLQAMAYAFDVLTEGRVPSMVVGAADEVYAQTYSNYDLIKFLFQGQEEIDYRYRAQSLKSKVLGEGAGALVLETADSAKARGAQVLAVMLGYGMSMDADGFSGQNMGTDGLGHALGLALERAGTQAEDIDLIVWAPQGNAQDNKTVAALKSCLGGRVDTVPFAATTFNTGYIEAGSILVTIAAVLESLRRGKGLWPQRTGFPGLDNRTLDTTPQNILAVGSSDLGYNYAAVLSTGSVA